MKYVPNLRRAIFIGINGVLAVWLWNELFVPTLPLRTNSEPTITSNTSAAPPLTDINPAGPSSSAVAIDLFGAANEPPPTAQAAPEPLQVPAIILVGTGLGESSFAVVRQSPAAPS